MSNCIKLLFLLFYTCMFSQNIKITILDNLEHKPVSEVQIFSENGSLLGSSNSAGEFEFQLHSIQEQGIKTIMIYDGNYLSQEFRIAKIPKIIYLEKIKSYELEPVVIRKKGFEEYYIVKGYIRSWKLLNNKLIKYGDAIIEYHIPYKNSENVIITGIKYHIREYRTFKTDSIKQKSRIISIHGYDSFLDYKIPKRDILADGRYYSTELVKDSLYNVLNNGKKVGTAIISNNNVAQTYIKESFEGDEAIKVLLWKLSVAYTDFEKWKGEDETRHLSYSFTNEKKLIETKIKGKFNAEETINEIFIDDEIIYDAIKPQKSKTSIDTDRSYYSTEYFKEQIKKHPLPKAIKEQLTNINENKNTYK
jgi:hypothetical protein